LDRANWIGIKAKCTGMQRLPILLRGKLNAEGLDCEIARIASFHHFVLIILNFKKAQT
jgi:hypothetical protein